MIQFTSNQSVAWNNGLSNVVRCLLLDVLTEGCVSRIKRSSAHGKRDLNIRQTPSHAFLLSLHCTEKPRRAQRGFDIRSDFAMPKHSWVGKQSKSFTNARSNAAGYAKRKSLKSKPLTNPSSDVYEYQQDRVRRGKVKLQLEKDELTGNGGGNGSGSDDDDEEEGGQHSAKNMRPRLVGEIDGDDQIYEDDDEELDSDGAFDESDEERFAGFDFSRGKVSLTVQSRSMNEFNTKFIEEQSQ